MHRKILGIVFAALAFAAIPATAGAIVPLVTPQSNPTTLGQDLIASGQIGNLTGSAFSQQPYTDDTETTHAPTSGEISPSLLGFPTEGGEAVVLTSGDANDIVDDQANESDYQWDDASYPHSSSANDVTTLRLTVNVPMTANCVALDYRFLSDEYPYYVGSPYNDAFIAEVDSDDWSNGDPYTVNRPHDFAADPAGEPVSVNGVGPTAMLTAEATGTIFNAATGLITTKQPITPGTHNLYFSIFDASDHILDSAVFMDNLRFISESAATCKPPLAQQLAPPPPGNPPPPNNFSFGSKVVFGKGTTTVAMTVPAPGLITATDASVATTAGASRAADVAKKKKAKKKALIKNTTVNVTAPGVVKVKLVLTKAGKKALKKKHGKLKVKVHFTYTPTGGTANGVTKSILFKNKT